MKQSRSYLPPVGHPGHTPDCYARQEKLRKEWREWEKVHPNACVHCDGNGEFHDQGSFWQPPEDYECEDCWGQGKCPWCGKEMEIPYIKCSDPECGWEHKVRGGHPIYWEGCECPDQLIFYRSSDALHSILYLQKSRIPLKIAVTRPLDGVCINGEREFLLESPNGPIMKFDSQKAAMKFLSEFGYADPNSFEFLKVADGKE